MSEAVSLDEVRLLAGIDLFAGLDRVALAQLAAVLQQLQAPAGQTIVQQGDAGDALFVVAGGELDVVFQPADGGSEVRLNRLGPGDYFGEMALLTDAPRSASVRAGQDSVLLRLDRKIFDDNLRRRPAMAAEIIRTLSERLRRADTARAAGEAALGETVQRLLRDLPANSRARLLEATLLPSRVPEALSAVFGGAAQSVAQDLRELTTMSGQPAPGILAALRRQAQQEMGGRETASRAREMARQLGDAHRWADALDLLAAHGSRSDLVTALAQALRDSPRPSADQERLWVERLTDDEAAGDMEIALARVQLLREQGDEAAAVALLRRAMETALQHGEELDERFSEEGLTATHPEQIVGESPAHSRTGHGVGEGLAPSRPPPRRIRVSTKMALAALALVLIVLGVVFGTGRPQIAFVFLLLAALVLWVGNVAADSFVALGLVTLWMLLKTVRPEQALSGFGSTTWLFVVAVLSLSLAVARSGLLFRTGLLLVQRMPRGLFPQACTLCLTGVLLTPLLPQGQGRVSLTFPLTVALADALELKPHDPRAALLGLSAWIGSAPMTFLFLNGSSLPLLAWGLLPAVDRARFSWVYWFIAALPLGLIAFFGSILCFYLLLRPGRVSLPARERLELQLAVLGPLSRREISMIVVLVLTVVGWGLAGPLGIDVGVIAVLGLIGAVITGNLTHKALQDLDWNYLLFLGAALSIGNVAVSLRLDRTAGATVRSMMSFAHGSPVLFILMVLLVSTLAQLVLSKGTAVLLLSLVLLPVAPSFHMNPWIPAIIILATSSMWFYRAQTLSYALAFSLSGGRLFTDNQGRLTCFIFIMVLLVGLIVSLPYWHLLGLV